LGEGDIDMVDITRARVLSTPAIYAFGVRLRINYDYALSTYGDSFSILTVTDEPLGNLIADGVDTLTVVSDKATIASDGIEEAVITCFELVTNMDYNIYRDDEMHLSGSVGDGSIEYSTNTPGTYIFEIIEPGTHNTGYVQLEVV
jgi:hypothetical protein